MARLRDVSAVVRRIGWKRLGLRVGTEVLEDHIPIFAAAVAYAWLFAIFPFFIFLANLAPMLLGDDPQGRRIIAWIFRHALPQPIVELFENHPILTTQSQPMNWVVGLTLLVALWAASNGMSVTMAVLDKCYEIERPRIYFKRRPMAFLLTLGCTLLLFCALLLFPVGRAFRDWYVEDATDSMGYDWVMVCFDFMRLTLGVAVVFTIVALIYHFGPCVKRRFRWITPGSVFAVVGWVVLGAIFNFYVELYAERGYGRTFGSAGGVALMLVLLYLDALVLMIGAEINSEIDFEMLGVKRGTRDFLTAERRYAAPAKPAAQTPVEAVREKQDAAC